MSQGTVLVTGATGFTGGATVEDFLARGLPRAGAGPPGGRPVVEEDRREKLVRLSGAGAAKLRQARPAWERAQERMRSRLPDGAWSGLLAALPDLARLADEA